MIKTAHVIQDETSDDEVGLNKRVKVYFEEDEEWEEFTLVTTVRGSSIQGLISTESPIGHAILGHKTGDRVFVKVNENAGYYVVIGDIEKVKDSDEIAIRKF